VLEQPLWQLKLTVVSMHWRRWPSFIVQRVAENGAAVVLGDTVVQLYIVELLGTLWFHFCVACGPVFILLCPVVPCVTLGLVVFAQWCRVLHWGL